MAEPEIEDAIVEGPSARPSRSASSRSARGRKGDGKKGKQAEGEGPEARAGATGQDGDEASKRAAKEEADAKKGKGKGKGKKDEEDKKEKDFYFQLSNIHATFESKMDNAFIELVVGGQTHVDTQASSEEKKIKRKRKDKDGNEVEVEETVVETRKRVTVLRPYAGRYFTRCKRDVKAKDSVSFSEHTFTGVWHGTYDQLREENLEVTVWQYNRSTANARVGAGTCSLLNIARGKMERDIAIEAGSRKEVVARVRVKVEFQETFHFVIELSDWQVKDIEPEEAKRLEDEVKDLDHESDEDSQNERGPEEVAEAELVKGPDGRMKKRTFDVPKGRAGEKKTKHKLRISMKGAHRSFFTRLYNTISTCRYDRDASRVSMDMKDGRLKAKHPEFLLEYRGTHAWLEEEALMVKAYKVSRHLGLTLWQEKIAEGPVHLQGVLDHGYLSADLKPVEQVASGSCGTCFSCLSCLPCCKSANGKAGKNGAQRAGKEEKEEAKQKQSRIVRVTGAMLAKKKPRYRQLGSAGRRKGGASQFLTTSPGDCYMVVKVVRAKALTSTDEYKEMLNPAVVLDWCGIRKSTRSTEGSDPYWDDEVFFRIPDVQNKDLKSASDFGEVAMRSVLQLSVWDNDGLSRSPLGYCEVPFSQLYLNRELLSDKYVFRAKMPLILPSSFVVEADHQTVKPKDNEKEEVKASTSAMIEFHVRFDNGKGDAGSPPKRDADAAKYEQRRVSDTDIRDPTPMYGESQVRAQAFWDEALRVVADVDSRSFAFMAKDEFTGKIHFLPKFVMELHPPSGIEDPYKLLNFVHCIEFAEKPKIDYELLGGGDRLVRNVWVWADPFFFLEKKKGDAKDHAVLLCSFLRGLGHDAYVCIGSARGSNPAKPTPHVWVMTIVGNEKNQDDDEKQGEQRKPKEKFVRFWEATQGRVYDLPASKFRFLKDDDDVRGGGGDGPQQPLARRKSQSGEPQRKPSRSDSRVSAMSDDSDNESAPGQRRPSFSVASDGDIVGVDKKTVDKSLDVGSTSAFAGAAESQVRQEREKQNKLVTHSDNLRINELYKELHDYEKFYTPYQTLDVVFNHKHLYANLQDANPEVISYCFNSRNRWQKFWRKNWLEFIATKKRGLVPFYPEKTLQSLPADEDECQSVESNIVELVRATIRAHREYECSAETHFQDEFLIGERMVKATEYIKERLQHHDIVLSYDRKLVSELADSKEEKVKSMANMRAEAEKNIEQWRKSIRRLIHPNTKYTERVLLFKHADPSRISDGVLEECKKMLVVDHRLDPLFAVGCFVERLPAMICPVRVLVMCIHKKSASN